MNETKCCGELMNKYGRRKVKEKNGFGLYQQYRCRKCGTFFIDVTDRKPYNPNKTINKSNDSKDIETTNNIKSELADGCMFSYKNETAPMSNIKPGATCVLSNRVPCSGTIVSKEKCPLWSGVGRVY